MTIRVNVLIGDEASNNLALKWGFWNPLFILKKQFDDLNIKFNFYKDMTDNSFFDCDCIFLNSRVIPKKKQLIDIDYLKNINNKNSNLIWFDMRDSAGTTQFEVMPYIKKYVKKQIYKDINLYKSDLYGGRFYTNYYSKNNGIKDKIHYKQNNLKNEFSKKLVIGWNIGVAKFFNYLDFNRLSYYVELFKSHLNLEDYTKTLKFQKLYPFKSNDIFFHMNKNFSRNTVGYQRKKIFEILKKEYPDKISNSRLSKKNYYKKLINSKVCVSAYGWGEVCFRDFEAVYCNTPFLTASMENISTWPNIYCDNETYVPYSLNFSDLNDRIKELLRDKDKREKITTNAQSVLIDSFGTNGQKHLLDKICKFIF